MVSHVHPPASARLAGSNRAHWSAALVLAGLVGLTGLLPHLWWSRELGHLAWFFNSYDEGYYGWTSLTELQPNRLISAGGLQLLHLLMPGANTQIMMVWADFILPFGCTLAACYVTRPLFKSPFAMTAGALFLLTSAECLALRSTLVPHAGWHEFLREKVVPLLGGPAGILQIDNLTGTFWLFRTPEPQTSWILLFLLLGLAVRLVLAPAPAAAWPRAAFWACSVALGLGYLFCALSAAGALALGGVLLLGSSRRLAWRLLGAAALVALPCLAASALMAAQLGGDSFLSHSRGPVLLLSSLSGLVAAGIVLRRWIGSGRLTPPAALALALGLTPLVVANQQLLTGRMIYLMNFENFGLSALAALALLLVFFPVDHAATNSEEVPDTAVVPSRRGAAVGAILSLGLLVLLGRSQVLSYRQYLDENRRAESYAQALRAAPAGTDLVACEEFLLTDILALKLGTRPNFLLARDATFSHPIARLVDPGLLPKNGSPARANLYAFLAIQGATPGEFATRLRAIVERDHPNWQDRFLLGGFLYNQVDYWGPMTHHRELKSSWIDQQRPLLRAEFSRYLAGPIRPAPVLYFCPQGRPVTSRPGWAEPQLVAANLGTPFHPLQAVRFNPIPGAREHP